MRSRVLLAEGPTFVIGPFLRGAAASIYAEVVGNQAKVVGQTIMPSIAAVASSI